MRVVSVPGLSFAGYIVFPSLTFFFFFNREHFSFFNFYLFIYLFYLWLCWVFVSVQGLSPVAASGGHSSSRCAGLSLSWPLLLRSTGSRRAGSVIVAHRPSCSAACGIFPDQGSNPFPLHWQADSQPLRHHGSPQSHFFVTLPSHLCPFAGWWAWLFWETFLFPLLNPDQRKSCVFVPYLLIWIWVSVWLKKATHVRHER